MNKYSTLHATTTDIPTNITNAQILETAAFNKRANLFNINYDIKELKSLLTEIEHCTEAESYKDAQKYSKKFEEIAAQLNKTLSKHNVLMTEDGEWYEIDAYVQLVTTNKGN